MIDLSGIWQVTDHIGEQARAGKTGYLTTGWQTGPVPGYFSEVPNLERPDGPLLYRRTFRLEPAPAPGTAVLLHLEGVADEAKLWCNGAFVGEQRAPFIPHVYELTRHLRPGDNVLMLELAGRTGRAGIRGPVWLERVAGLAPSRLVVNAAPAGETARVAFELDFAAMTAGEVAWTATVAPETFDGPAVTAKGESAMHRGWNRLTGALAISEPRLWWTWDQGEANLYRLTLEVRRGDGSVKTLERLFGIRTAELKNWFFYLNRRRLFIRGANYTPDQMKAASDRAGYIRDLELARAANINTLRIQDHVLGDALYEEASRRGILLWQEVPAGVSQETDIAALVGLIGHYPAVGLWSAPEEVEQGFFHRLVGQRATAALATAVGKADGTRSVAHRWEETAVVRGEDAKGLPDKARLIRSFGAPSLPEPAFSRSLIKGEWPNLNWADLGAERLTHLVPTSLAQSTEQYIAATQRYQSFVVRRTVEHFRRRRYHAVGGLFLDRLVDGAPAVSAAVLDYRRTPKAAYQALAESYRPVTILADWPAGGYAAGEAVRLDVHLINDRYQPYQGEWQWAIRRGDELLATGSGPAELPADSITTAAVGVDWTVPSGLKPGGAELRLSLVIPGMEPLQTSYGLDILQ